MANSPLSPWLPQTHSSPFLCLSSPLCFEQRKLRNVFSAARNVYKNILISFVFFQHCRQGRDRGGGGKRQELLTVQNYYVWKKRYKTNLYIFCVVRVWGLFCITFNPLESPRGSSSLCGTGFSLLKSSSTSWIQKSRTPTPGQCLEMTKKKRLSQVSVCE